MPWHPQVLADQLTLYQPGGADYAHHITTDWHPRIFRPSYGPEYFLYLNSHWGIGFLKDLAN